jgi:dihydroneopterin aldolase
MKINCGTQVLAITGLRFDANLGILDHEIGKPQPLAVDVELNMGTQPLLPDDDEIMSVLDYRRVHDIIIECCTETHVNLLESLTGKLCLRLMELTGVIGVRAKVVKLKIFDDCEVAIKQQIGDW